MSFKLAEDFFRRISIRICSILLVSTGLAILSGTVMAQDKLIKQDNYSYSRAYRMRADSVINYFATNRRPDYYEAAARFYKGKDIKYAISIMDSMTHRQEVEPSGDMFWMWPVVYATFTGQKYYPTGLKKRMRALWKNYHPYRGDTENHFIQYYSSLYLITQMFPNEPASSWYDGKSSAENHEEAKEYINSWINLTVTKGQGEFDSPTYYEFYITPLCNLYAFSKDPKMKKRAKMMLDYLLTDFAIDNLNGIYCGAHSRIYPRFIKDQWNSNSTAVAWLAFGNTYHKYSAASLMMATSGYEPPEIIRNIAVDRSVPYESYELKRTRHRIRFSKIMDKPVYKYMYMTNKYAIGSIQGGLLQPIQQETWEVNWVVPDPRKGNYSIHTIQPHSSGYELATYFPEEIKLMTADVVKSKGNYDNPNKWIGGSPYEQVYQKKSALIELYDIRKGARFSTVDTQFPKTLSRREVDKSGWIFARGGDTYIAYYPLAKYKWIDEKTDYRLRSTILKNGAVVQVASTTDYPTFDAFKKAVKALPLKTRIKPLPYVDFTSLKGDHMICEYGKTPILNGKPVDYKAWKLFDCPYTYAEPYSKKLLLKYGDQRYLLDFNNLKIKSWITKKH